MNSEFAKKLTDRERFLVAYYAAKAEGGKWASIWAELPWVCAPTLIAVVAVRQDEIYLALVACLMSVGRGIYLSYCAAAWAADMKSLIRKYDDELDALSKRKEDGA